MTSSEETPTLNANVFIWDDSIVIVVDAALLVQIIKIVNDPKNPKPRQRVRSLSHMTLSRDDKIILTTRQQRGFFSLAQFCFTGVFYAHILFYAWGNVHFAEILQVLIHLNVIYLRLFCNLYSALCLPEVI